MQLQVTIRGKHIELDQEPGLPTGSVVQVTIHAQLLTLEEKRQLVDELCGAWATDDSLQLIFDEIESQRALAAPRVTDFDVTS